MIWNSRHHSRKLFFALFVVDEVGYSNVTRTPLVGVHCVGRKGRVAPELHRALKIKLASLLSSFMGALLSGKGLRVLLLGCEVLLGCQAGSGSIRMLRLHIIVVVS
jgi:hypothetical protein